MAQGLLRRHRVEPGGGPVQVDVDDAVGEPGCHGVRDVDGQGGLADTAGPVDQGDGGPAVGAQCGAQVTDFSGAGGEGVGVGGQFGRRVRLPDRDLLGRGGQVETRVLGQHGLVHAA